jgi:hypothetical protein
MCRSKTPSKRMSMRSITPVDNSLDAAANAVDNAGEAVETPLMLPRTLSKLRAWAA